MNISLPKRIALLYSDAKREYFPTEQLFISEVEVKERAFIVAGYLNKMGIDTACFPGNDILVENLKKYHPDFVINMVDTVYGQEYLAGTIPATLELLNMPYTGSSMMGININNNKYFTKNILEQWGLTTPKYQLLHTPGDKIDIALDFPLVTKLNDFHGSIEMSDDSICENEKALEKRLKYLFDTYKEPILVEEYIAGREVSVHVIEGVHTKLYAGEKIFNDNLKGKYKIATFDSVWGTEFMFTYVKYELPERVKESLKIAFDVLKLEDYAKFDLRVDESGRHYIIDVNANPALGPKYDCSIGTILDMYGISFEALLERLIYNTVTDPENKILF